MYSEADLRSSQSLNMALLDFNWATGALALEQRRDGHRNQAGSLVHCYCTNFAQNWRWNVPYCHFLLMRGAGGLGTTWARRPPGCVQWVCVWVLGGSEGPTAECCGLDSQSRESPRSKRESLCDVCATDSMLKSNYDSDCNAKLNWRDEQCFLTDSCWMSANGAGLLLSSCIPDLH